MNTEARRDAVTPLYSPAFVRDPYPTYRQHLAGPVVQASTTRPDWGPNPGLRGLSTLRVRL